MTLYEINKQIESLIDEETGEIAEGNAYDQLEMMRNEKLENIALYIKNLGAEADALKTEIKNLQERKAKAEKKVDSLKALLCRELNGSKFETPRCAISFRKSLSADIEDEKKFMDWAMTNGDEYLRYKEPEINKDLLRRALMAGEEIPFTKLSEKNSVQIK